MKRPKNLCYQRKEVSDYIDRVFLQAHHGGRILFLESVAQRKATVRMVYHERSIRPGGTISGPAMFTLADFGIYVAILASKGPVEMAVTTNLSINFLQPSETDRHGRTNSPVKTWQSSGRWRGRYFLSRLS